MPQAHLICTTKQCNILESDFHIYRIKNRLFILCPLCSVSVFFFHFNINKIWTNNNHVLFVFYFLLLFEFFSALTFCLCPCTQDQLRGRPTVQKNKRKLRPPPWNHHNNKKNPKSENFIKKATNTPKLLVNKSTILIETHTTQKQPDSDWTAFSTKFTAVDCLFFFQFSIVGSGVLDVQRARGWNNSRETKNMKTHSGQNNCRNHFLCFSVKSFWIRS